MCLDTAELRSQTSGPAGSGFEPHPAVVRRVARHARARRVVCTSSERAMPERLTAILAGLSPTIIGAQAEQNDGLLRDGEGVERAVAGSFR